MELKDYCNSIVIGLVSPVGCNKKNVVVELKKIAHECHFQFEIIKLSKKINEIYRIKSFRSRYHEIRTLMDKGDELRMQTNENEIVTMACLIDIYKNHLSEKTNKRYLFLIDSLKNRSEIDLLRRVFGDNFYLLGLYENLQSRKDNLYSQGVIEEHELEDLIRNDNSSKNNKKEILKFKEDKDFGQQMQDIYHLSDVFVESQASKNIEQIRRFFNVIMGDPFELPSRNEYYMYLAYASSVCSSDLGRQVGAVLISENNELISSGYNEVPKAGGGVYPYENLLHTFQDAREFQQGVDTSKIMLSYLSEDIVDLLLKNDFISQKSSGEIKEMILRDSRLSHLTEFTKALHAEMCAIFSALAQRKCIRNAKLFVTTFPCHNCAKHIIASGIKDVYFVEPYPKSKALEIHSDSIILEEDLNHTSDNKVRFISFKGIGPNRFFDLFSIDRGGYPQKKRKDQGIIASNFNLKDANLRSREKEFKIIGELKNCLQEFNKVKKKMNMKLFKEIFEEK